MIYNNKFFRTEGEAKQFCKAHGGALLHMTERSRKETKIDFLAECVVALDARGEVIDPNVTPWCVAWNEREP